MRFVDVVKIWVQSGDGGNGCRSFRREKYVPRGGPDGGDGGRGGHVILVATDKNPTLLDHSYQQHYVAPRGRHGKGKQQHGKNGNDLKVPVPAGTVVRDAETGEILKDLAVPGDRFIAARGGRGGKGNAAFKSSTNRAPQYAQPGEEGERRRLTLELKLIADAGLVGLPNAGKSTLISTISAARPRIADYPFTTLTPQLGVVTLDENNTMVVADIPGIIKGAHKGAGLGLTFLRHIERTHILIVLIDLSVIDGKNPGEQYQTILQECAGYNPDLLKKPRIVVLNKADLLSSQNLPGEIQSYYQQLKEPFVLVSALTGAGIDELLALIRATLAAVYQKGLSHEE